MESLLAALLEIDPQFLERWKADCRARVIYEAEAPIDLRD
jgi:hypothetical protein